MRRLLSFCALVLTPFGPVQGENVWHIYPGDDDLATLVVLDKSEIDQAEAYWSFMMQCWRTGDWTMTIAAVDEKQLGAAIAEGSAVDFGFVVDGELNGGGLNSYFPELRFSQMLGEWEYWAAYDYDTILDLAAASTLAIRGLGVDLPLPPDGSQPLAKFAAICKEFVGEESLPP